MARFLALMAICCLHAFDNRAACSDFNTRSTLASELLTDEKINVIDSHGTYEDPNSSGDNWVKDANKRKRYMSLYDVVAAESMLHSGEDSGLMRFNSMPYFMRNFGAPRSPNQITSAIERMLERYAKKSGRW